MNSLQPATQTQSRGSVQGLAVSTGKRGHTPRNANLKLQCNYKKLGYKKYIDHEQNKVNNMWL